MIAPHHAATASKPRRWLVNLGLALLNGLIVTSLCAACYVIALRRMAPWRVGLFELTAAPSWLRLPAEIGALDLLTYWLHRGYHRVPLLWRFHRVHHTDLDLDVSSASRFHLGEVLASSVAKLAFVALLGISYQGLVAFEIVLLLAAQFQHANIGVHPRLEPMLWWTFVPPAMHRVHHSPQPDETDSNFGTLLVAWDRLFATLRTHTAFSPPFGLWDWRDARRLGLGKILALPFFRGCAAATEAQAGTGERLEPATESSRLGSGRKIQ
jgi:sterol desaturase/sphingolipid hydroxylase (fatty acid hydroxylase superfamily)